MMITRRCLADVGRWDESYFLYSEETDFCLRAREKGYALRFVPAAEAIHLGGYSHVSPRLWTILTLSRVRLFARRHGMLRSAAFIVALGLNEALRFRRAKHRAALRALLFPGRRPLRLTG